MTSIDIGDNNFVNSIVPVAIQNKFIVVEETRTSYWAALMDKNKKQNEFKVAKMMVSSQVTQQWCIDSPTGRCARCLGIQSKCRY